MRPSGYGTRILFLSDSLSMRRQTNRGREKLPRDSLPLAQNDVF
jgi:hypothetical protein